MARDCAVSPTAPTPLAVRSAWRVTPLGEHAWSCACDRTERRAARGASDGRDDRGRALSGGGRGGCLADRVRTAHRGTPRPRPRVIARGGGAVRHRGAVVRARPRVVGSYGNAGSGGLGPGVRGSTGSR